MSEHGVLQRLALYARLMRLDRPIGTLLLLWPTLWALWIAATGPPDPDILAVFVAGVFLMRSAGCVINDIADRHIDPHVARTRERPLATGALSVAESLILFFVLVLIAFGLVLTLNRLTVLLAVAGAVLAASYPFLKRFTHLPQFYLGLAFGWSVPMAFAAQTGALPGLAWLLLVAVMLWAVAYDTMYAMVDRADDLRIGVKSTAVLLGKQDRLGIGIAQTLMLLALAQVGRTVDLGGWFWAGLTLAGLHSLYQQYLIRDREPAACFRAFLSNNLLGAIVFVGIFADLALNR